MNAQHVAEASRQRLASALAESGVLTSTWLDALAAAPRDLFVPARAWAREDQGHGRHWLIDRYADSAAWWRAVGEDSPITTQFDDGASGTPDAPGTLPSSSNSMPTMVFAMLDALDVGDGGVRVLEIGTGTGWNAALLASRLGPGRVVTVEYDAAVAAQARARLDALGLGVETAVGDGAAGWPAGAPYDRVIATCSVERVPVPWLRQTRPGGVVLTPLGPRFGGEGIVRLTVHRSRSADGRFVRPSGFMRMRQQRGRRREPIEYLDGQPWPGAGERSQSGLSPREVVDFNAKFAIGAQLPEVELLVERSGTGFCVWVTDGSQGGTSWATADYLPDRDRFEVVQDGPRRLWDEVSAAWSWWDAQGRPPVERFWLTVSPDGDQCYHLDGTSRPVPNRTAGQAVA